MRLERTYEKDRVHDEWEAVYRDDPDLDRFNDRLMDRILAAMALPPSARVLDAGCGVGDHAIRIARRGYSCVGVDLSSLILERARRRAAEAGIDETRLSWVRGSLEDLPFETGSFDAVHCRGVLMHVPDWEAAVASLARVLKPGGLLAVLESNRRSLETAIVLCVRSFAKRESRMLRSASGLEFWSERDGTPFLVRIADVERLAGTLRANGIRIVTRFAGEFWDVNRFPAGIVRRGAVLWNRAHFSLRLPPSPSMGNVLIGRKVG